MLVEGKEIVGSRFKVGRKIGNGSFGEIYEGKLYLISVLALFNDFLIVIETETGLPFAAKVVS